MKKLLSIMLALILVFSMATVAFAEDGEETPEWNGVYAPLASFHIDEQILKTYTAPDGLKVAETLSFTSVASTDNPDGGQANLEIDDLVITDSNFNNKAYLDVTVPELSTVGEYTWTISETKGNTPGVDYTKSTITVKVLVVYDNDEHKLVIGNTKDKSGIIWYVTAENGKKADTFANTYSVGSFTVEKDVIGNLANENDAFDITVKLTSEYLPGSSFDFAGTTVAPSDWIADGDNGYYYSKELSYSEASGAKTFSNIPYGVKVSAVTESTSIGQYSYVGTFVGDYTVAEDLTVSGDKFAEYTVNASNAEKTITVVNKQDTTIETGITLDSVPYFLMLSIACVGMFLLLSKKRANREY